MKRLIVVLASTLVAGAAAQTTNETKNSLRPPTAKALCAVCVRPGYPHNRAF